MSIQENPASSDERGVTMILMAIMVIAFLGIAALVVDLGYGYSIKRQLSSTADASALAGAQEAGFRFNEVVDGCGTLSPSGEPSAPLKTYITDAVNSIHNESAPTGVTAPPTTTITCDAAGLDATKITVTVLEQATLKTFLGGLLGVDSLVPTISATAEIYGSDVQGGLRPFTVCLPVAQDSRNNLDTTYQTNYRTPDNTADGSGCTNTGAPGNWGYARFGLGNDDNTISCLAKYGYGTPVPSTDNDCRNKAPLGSPGGVNLGDLDTATPEIPSLGYTGNAFNGIAADKAILDSLVDTVILLPVADNWDGSGSGANYKARGAIAVRLCGYAFPKNDNDPVPKNGDINRGGADPDLASCWNNGVGLGSPATRDSKYLAEWAPKTSLSLQWRYVGKFSGPFLGTELSPAQFCKFNDATCLTQLRLIS